MTETGAHPRKMNVAESMRSGANMLCLWRICGNAACRRAKSCRGRVHLCGPRNYKLLPEGVRGFFELFLAAKYAGIAFDDFKEERGGGRRKPSVPGARRPRRLPDGPHDGL
jgi:hypothetical protein